MNLGDGLLFEFENGKPKLILLSHGVENNPAKQLLYRPRAANNILSSRQLSSCLEDVQGVERPSQQQQQQQQQQQPGRYKEVRSKTAGPVTSYVSNTSTTKERTHGHHNGAGIKTVTQVNSHRHKQGSSVGSSRASGKTANPQNSGGLARAGGKAGLEDKATGRDAAQKDNVGVLTHEQLQQILNTFQTSSTGQQPLEDYNVQGGGGGGGEMKEEDRGGGKVLKRVEGGGGVMNTTGSRLSGCLFSWLEERQSDSRLAAKKAQWRRELDEQVALKQQQQQQQQRLVPDRPQTGEDRESVLSRLSSTKHWEQPAAIRSSLKLGDITPVEEVMSVNRREEQRRCWLEELDRQREEAAERRRREKVLQNQTEDHDLWNIHFDSLQRRAPVHTTAPSAPPPAPSIASERGEWEPSSSLSLVWDATSSCGAESVDLTNRFPSRTSYLRTMTALLDPAQIEERERRRLKQLEQQRAIEAQVEERRQQREREQTRRREEEDRDARRVAAEREMLQRQYELESQKVRDQQEQPSQPAEEPREGHNEPNVTSHLEESVGSSLPLYRDTAVQTDAPSVPLPDAQRVQTPDVSAQYQASGAPPNGRNPAARTGKENICLPRGGGEEEEGDPYEAFARTERNKRDKGRPEWNTQKPSRRFVPASERYPAALQRNRQESRLKRQAELLALQDRTCLSRTELPPPQYQDPRLCSNFTKAGAGLNTKVETVPRGQNGSTVVNNERHRTQSRQVPNPLPPLVQEFVPYIRTDEITLDPLESADPLPHTYTDAAPLSSASPPASSHRDSPLLQPEQLCKTHTQRQQEILRGLAQLRQGLLQKQRELETDLNPLLKRHDNKL